MDAIATRGLNSFGRKCTWFKAECSDMPLHVRMVKEMMARSEVSLLSLGAIDGDGTASLRVGKYELTSASARSLNEQVMELCISMMDKLPEAELICPIRKSSTQCNSNQLAVQ